jgi:hypothetical protein
MYRGFSLSMHSVGSMEGGFLPNRVLNLLFIFRFRYY